MWYLAFFSFGFLTSYLIFWFLFVKDSLLDESLKLYHQIKQWRESLYSMMDSHFKYIDATKDYFDKRENFIKQLEDKKGIQSARILWNRRSSDSLDPGSVDEIVVKHPQSVHIKQIDDNCYWISIRQSNDSYWSGNFFSQPDGTLNFGWQENYCFFFDEDKIHELPTPPQSFI